jgi:hypothetical protein
LPWFKGLQAIDHTAIVSIGSLEQFSRRPVDKTEPYTCNYNEHQADVSLSQRTIFEPRLLGKVPASEAKESIGSGIHSWLIDGEVEDEENEKNLPRSCGVRITKPYMVRLLDMWSPGDSRCIYG